MFWENPKKLLKEIDQKTEAAAIKAKEKEAKRKQAAIDKARATFEANFRRKK